MAIWDVVNSDKDKYDLGGTDYNPYQSNAAGEDLAPVNYKGQLAAVDPDNDTRSPDQFKRDAQQAQRDASNSPDEDENMFISDNGNKYEKVNTSALHEGLAAGMEFVTAFWASGGNMGAALDASGRKIDDMQAQAHRQSQINDLEAKGYNPLDIDVWQKTGDRKALITNKGEWSAVGDGQTLYNKLTGETKLVAGTNKTIKDTKVLDDGRILNTYSDGTQSIQNPDQMGGNAPTVQNTNYGPGNLPGGGSLDNANAPQHLGLKMNKGKPIPMDNVYSKDGKQAFVGPNNEPVDGQGNLITDISGMTPAQQEKAQAAQEKAQAANQDIVANGNTTIAQIDKVLNSRSLDDAYGKWNAKAQGTLLESQSVKDLRADINQLGSGAFLQARAMLKNQGAISDTESKKAEQAFARFTDPSISTEAAKSALNDYKAIIQTGIDRAKKGLRYDGSSLSQPAQQAPQQNNQQGGVINITRGPDGKLVRAGG